MAYVNVAEWKPDQVTEWLKGLDSSILVYLHLFISNEVNGQQLLNVRSEDLDNLGIKRLGHQELILEAVEHLRNFHYELDRENLQLLALRLSCQAHSLHNELLRQTDSQPVSTQTLADVASVVRAVKPLVCWLDRSPFTGQLEYSDRKRDLLKYSLEIATCAQRDRFAERPVEEIRSSCAKLSAIADGIIQDIADPLILQPASLDLATLRKRGGDDLGFYILPSFCGVHQIGDIKFGSPAHQCGKVEEGDEVVQVNYQTIVGWQRKKVMALFEESATDVFLTLKKRPRHTKVYGQIYMKPYRLPSKKRAPAYTRWHDNLPSPRPELLTIPDFDIQVPRALPMTPPSKHVTLEPLNSTIVSTSSESEDAGSGCDEASLDYELEGHTSPTSMRLYLPKPRVPVQRRATITGASPTSHLPPVDLEKFWRELKLEKKWKFNGKTPESHNSNPECGLLRNKSPCEHNERPSTCLGFEKSSSKEYIKRVDYIIKSDKDSKDHEELTKGQEKSSEQKTDIVTLKENEDMIKSSNFNKNRSEKRFITRLELKVDPRDSRIRVADVTNENVELKSIPGDETSVQPDSPHTNQSSPFEKTRKVSTESQIGELPVHRERGRLDKSFSTPAYDLLGLDGLEINASRQQKSPAVKVDTELADKSGLSDFSSPNDSVFDYGTMPDVASSTTPRMKQAQDYSTHSFFKFPPAHTSSRHASTDQEFDKNNEDIKSSDNCDMNLNPVLHGRVVETINRHLLDSNCGKDGDEDCDDHRDNNRTNPPSGFTRTVTSIVLNSPDLISDISTHRLYPKPDDYDNGNHFHLQISPKLESFRFDGNKNSYDIHPAAPKTSDSKVNPEMVNRAEIASPKLIVGDVKMPVSLPLPPARHPDPPCPPTKQPKIPFKISVNPPEPPPRPTPPNRSPSIPLDQPKSLLRAKIGSKTTSQQKAVVGSPKVSRKKNPFLARRRSVGVKELGVADYQGWLYRRTRIGDSGVQWIKGWFILKSTAFYGFKSREAHKADYFISLPGFTISPAEEVKSKKFAFKVYHTGTAFYFASESDEELAAWLDCLSMAALSIDIPTSKSSASEGAVFSETEDEGDESEIADSCFPSPKMRKFTNFLSGHSSHTSHSSGSAGSPKPARSHQNLASSSESKTYDIQKKFGSLKKLGYRNKCPYPLSSQSSSSATSLSSSEQSQDAQPASAPHSLDRKVLRFLSSGKSQNVPVPTAQFRSYRRVVATEPCSTFAKHTDGNANAKGDESLLDTSGGSHAARSVGSSSGDQDIRRNNRNLGPRGDDVAGFLTLEQFMLQRQEEERQQNLHSNSPQNHDRDSAAPGHRDTSEAYTGYTEDPVLSRHKSLEKRRTPPPAPPSLSPSPRPNTRPIPAVRTILPGGSTQQGDASVEPPVIVPRTLKPSNDSHSTRESHGTGKHLSESSTPTLRRTPLAPMQPRLKNAALYQPPPVAFSPTPSLGPSFEMHLDHQASAAHASPDEVWEGSRARGASSKIRQFLTPKRSHHLSPPSQPEVSAPTPQRTILGSPRLHRALFRQSDSRKQKNTHPSDSSEHFVYTPGAYGSVNPSATSSPLPSPDWSSDFTPSLSPKPTMGVAMIGKKPAVSPLSNFNSLSAMSPPLSPPQTPLSPPPDYPGLEYPPVFEPGIYSLSDSSTLLSPSTSVYSPGSDSSGSLQPRR
ncbi:uncharacterized protein LOC117643365 [Thrips palmi]|uniref:Uncharacterized protein LOC117643365 n=1 Tax=Thrips palmi TaxID=161013 RepID=A0A6P8ZL22_THRPL|nr:uncharacterized protein LOC117643365 [Thrips palmi]